MEFKSSMAKIKMNNFFKALRFTLYPLYLISFLIPKQNNLWVFGAHHNRFSENSKNLFLYTSSECKNIKSVWITGDRELVKNLQRNGLISYSRWSFRGLYTCLRAKNYFYNVYSDDINFYTSANSTLINLWHGIPLKTIEFDIHRGPLQKMFNSNLSYIYMFFKPYIFKNPSYVLSTSSNISKILASAFRVNESQCLELGYPRTDVFYTPQDNHSDIFIDALYETIQNIKSTNQVIIYMPTWRSNNTNLLKKALPNLELLNNTLLLNKQTLLVKLHPNDFTEENNFSNILFINPKSDIYPLLSLSDYLITDYSSIYFDYLLLDKEIIFYPFDLEYYFNEDREFYFDYNDVTPGVKINDFEALLEQLNSLQSLDYSQVRTQIRDRFWHHQDAAASQRISEYFIKKID